MKQRLFFIIFILINLSVQAQVFTSSDLPIVLIDTEGQEIPDDPKIRAGMKIIDNGPGARNYLTDAPEFDGFIGIEIRGSSSQMFPKKSYGFETWDVDNNDINVSLLGMPEESDWILNANYTDKTFCRNALAYQVSRNMGHYSVRYKFVEVVLNGSYTGIYIFSEKIKRDANRVNIAKLEDDQNSGDLLTGGYIIKVDKTTGSGGDGWVSDFPPPVNPSGQTIFFQYEYPKSEDITLQQQQYISDYMDDFETALAGPQFADPEFGFRKFAQEGAFLDYFLVNEMSKNVDGYRLSTFLHKQRESLGGKLRIGPVWDYDIAWHNANYCEGDVLEGWAYQFPCPDDYWQVPFWWGRLLEDSTFANNLKCRWTFLRQDVLSNAWFDQYIDSVAMVLDESQARNFNLWPILGEYVWPNPWPYPETYAEEIASLKSWIHLRLAWMDDNLPGICYTTYQEEIIHGPVQLKLFPNPVENILSVSLSALSGKNATIEITDLSGRILLRKHISLGANGGRVWQHDVSQLSKGIWLLKITGEGQTYTGKFVKQ
ncbi:MAG: CotH kinase family protein [Lentimicrobium sp.]|jgi:hypothetical protein|nr:CotH kinase family protein [Lentimicrobium sp.]